MGWYSKWRYLDARVSEVNMDVLDWIADSRFD